MPTIDTIYRYFYGVWRMMTGKSDGLAYLDISADGFWRSFYAILVSLPPLLAGWVAYAAELTGGREETAMRFSIVIKAAIVDITAWILPIFLLGLVVSKIGIAKRFAPYVIASNWGTALLAWAFAPISLLQLVMQQRSQTISILSLVFMIAIIVMSYRLTRTALQKPTSFALPFYIAMFMVSFAITIMLQELFGINYDFNAGY
ncbi:hypothetical protein ACI0FM_02735 [Paenochrobactrum sp. BZR 588]|uniref:hypothetical protein n=1 Tax=unclassified Paenochrobactrum TaxID=2639760 RepID=UPI0038548A5C